MSERRLGLLVIDMNKGSFREDSRGGRLHNLRAGLTASINELAAAFRDRGLPVVWVTQRYKDDLSDAPTLQRKRADRTFAESSDGWQLLPELDVHPDDLTIIKRNYSAFFDTNLYAELQRLSVTGLVVCGVNTYACVRCSTIDAYQHGFDPIFWAADCLASSLPQFEEDAVRYMIGDAPGRGSLVQGLLANREVLGQLDA